MNILIILVPCSLILGGTALALFFWTLRTGQYEDLEGDAARALADQKQPSCENGNNHSR